jgi:hypothetical protein
MMVTVAIGYPTLLYSITKIRRKTLQFRLYKIPYPPHTFSSYYKQEITKPTFRSRSRFLLIHSFSPAIKQPYVEKVVILKSASAPFLPRQVNVLKGRKGWFSPFLPFRLFNLEE